MRYRVSIDIGGTFTDTVLVDQDGRFGVFKSPTTHENYVDAVVSNLNKASRHFDISLENLMANTASLVGGSLVHGSTISTNALIEGKTAKTGLICTRGFRDILTDREGGLKDPFDWDRDYPRAYIPRYLTLPVTERINAEGGVEVPLNEDDVRAAVRQFKAWKVQAIAVSLLWSIANPAHELRIGEIVREEAPDIPCVLSHQVNPIIREYRRTSSTAINASLIPIVEKYIQSFEDRLSQIGYNDQMLMLTAAGGVISAAELLEKPIYSVDCGPSLAPTAGLWYARQELDESNIITADMGGTSFDISCVTDGEIAVSREAWVSDYMLGISKVDTKSIGAGGGSIAWVDSGGMLHVGPQSAGSEPGPACYGRGGTAPTITDANVVLGYIDPEYFLGGEMPLYPEKAEQVIRDKVAGPLALSLEEAAFTIWSTVNVGLVSAIEDITVWQGIDPREYVFLSGGGAAGLHMVPVVKELGAERILIPRTASVISAMGGVVADLTAEFSATRFAETSNMDFDGVNTELASLRAEAEAFLDRAGVKPEDRHVEFYTEARYPNQVWELAVPLRTDRFQSHEDVNHLEQDFHQAHDRVFGISEPGQSIECIYFQAKAVGRIPKPKLIKKSDVDADSSRAKKVKRKAYFKNLGGMVETQVYDGQKLKPGNEIAGPAIIEEPTTTVVVFPGSNVRVTPLGSYLITIPKDN
jgi:N-methylhydantoinase A